MRQFIVYDSRGNYDLANAQIMNTFEAKNSKKAIKLVQKDFKDIDCVLCDSQSNVIWSAREEY